MVVLPVIDIDTPEGVAETQKFLGEWQELEAKIKLEKPGACPLTVLQTILISQVIHLRLRVNELERLVQSLGGSRELPKEGKTE